MKKIILATLLSLLPSLAFAQATFTFKDAAGATQTVKSFNCTPICPMATLADTTGASIYGTAGTANATVLTIQGIASMTKLLVTPDSVALPANQSINNSQINGVTPLMGNGVTGTGSQRVTIASDNTAFSVNAAVPTWAGGALGAMANYGTSPGAVLVPGINAFVTNTNTNGQATMANSSPIVLSSNQSAEAAWGQVATGAAPPTGTQYVGANASGATGGLVAGLITCDKHVFKHITSATDTLAVQGVASQTIRVCGWRSRAAGVATWFLENTASANANCSSSNTQITGVATEATNTGETLLAPFWTGLANTSGNGLCINSTGTGGVDIDIWYNQF